MIHAKDLMIGDWVKMNWGPAKITAIKEGDIHFVDRFGGGISFCCEELPITPKILEKNGFIKRYNYQWKYRDNSCTIVISIAPQIEIDGEMLGTPPINVNLEGALFNINMTSDMCVHQLQNALRLCGIEKEITL